MNLASVMDTVADRASTIQGLNVFPHPVAKITPPAFVVSLPESIQFHQTGARGMDKMTLPGLLAIGYTVLGKSARDDLAAYANGSGPRSLIQALEADAPNDAYDDLTVVRMDFDVVTFAGVSYLAALLEITVTGRGG